ncbi:DUF2147 domain-containing protein [Quisquiliibacterium transsilvanicum]|uniref:Uncharacterized protein (DUF2147 family) n=1 Tax=Quisquiliibacterium transsilvanicum TaxID=1549638 RepID=A0A7W8HGT4_9BURK|nr:uncharacterized protein (DUF2147 family) [Quisquiliibacterium transsilvanicum]
MSNIPGRASGLRRAAAPLLLAAIAFAGAGMAGAQDLSSPVGLWKTIDDESKQPRSLVRIVEQEGALVGRIEKILTDKTDARCDRCTDERKDQPVLGMTIVTGMKRDGELWDGGSILDPNNGKVYRSRMKLLEGGRKLEVRGYIGAPLFGRSQTWLREE